MKTRGTAALERAWLRVSEAPQAAARPGLQAKRE